MFAIVGVKGTGGWLNFFVTYCMSVKKLKGQIALVTGGSSGIGKAIAIALGEAGAAVIVNYYSGADAAEEVVSTIRQNGSDAIAIKADVSKEEEVFSMFGEIIQQYGTLDILINNAGLQQDAPFHEMTLQQWQKVIDVNLTGQFLCAREAIREFLRRGHQPERSKACGKIVCISSVHELIPWAGHVNYAASKGAIKMLMQSQAQEYGPQQIRVNSICPGAIRTPINREAWETKAAYDSLMSLIPYNRIGEPDDVGKLAVFLASDDSDYITGTSIFIDGGMAVYESFADGG